MRNSKLRNKLQIESLGIIKKEVYLEESGQFLNFSQLNVKQYQQTYKQLAFFKCWNSIVNFLDWNWIF